MNAFLLYKYLGVFRDEAHVESYPHVTGARPGDLILEDYDGDGKITTDDRQLFPLTNVPEMTFGFSFDFSYRNWELRGLVQGQARAMQRIYNQMIVGTGGNYLKYDADDRWTPENTNATKPRAFERTEEYWRADYENDYLFSRTDFARLKNLQLSYRLPRDLQNQLKLRDAKIFFAGQNLLMIYSGHKVDSMDPERGGTGSYPIMSVLSIGAEVTF
jgi:hypothetical protein